jgi:hypothetical protein
LTKGITILSRGAATVADIAGRPIVSGHLAPGSVLERDRVLLEQDLAKPRFGIWASPAYTDSYLSYPYNELMVLSAGRVEIEDMDGSVVTFGPGDAFIMHEGFAGTWRQLDPMIKYYLIYS